MGLLDHATRSDLLAALETMVVLDTLDGRTLLLQDLPPALAGTVVRDEAKIVDLANMLRAADAWSPAALRTLIETARDLVPGSTCAAQLQTVLATLAAPPEQLSAALPLDPRPTQPLPTLAPLPRRITARMYTLAFAVAFCGALLIQYLTNTLIGRTDTGWILIGKPALEDWLIALIVALLPALFAAWAIQRLSPSWLIAQLVGNIFGLALFRMVQAPLLDFTPFGIGRGIIALFVSCAMIAVGILAGLVLIEQRRVLENPGL